MMNPFEELLDKLARAEVRFVLVGGGAVVLQGYGRNTHDLDVIIEASKENSHRVITALSAWGKGSAAELGIEELAEPERGAVRVIEDFPLDIFTLMRARKAGRDFSYAELAEDALPYELFSGAKILFASIPKLLDLKAGTGRLKDQTDSDALNEIARGQRERAPRQLSPPTSRPGDGPSTDFGDWPGP